MPARLNKPVASSKTVIFEHQWHHSAEESLCKMTFEPLKITFPVKDLVEAGLDEQDRDEQGRDQGGEILGDVCEVHDC